MKKLISDSPTLPTQSMDGTLDQKYIIIDVTPAIKLILEGNTPDTIALFPAFMKIPNYISGDMAIHSATDIAKALQTLRPESPLQMGDDQIKAIK